MLRRLTTVPFSFNFIFSLSADYWPSCSKSTSLGRHALGNAKSDHKWPRTIFLCQRPEPSIILLCPSWAIFCGLSFPVRWHSRCLFLRLGTSVVDDVIQLKLREGRWDRDLWPDTDTVGEMINAFPELGLVTNRYRRLVRQRASEQDRKKKKRERKAISTMCLCVCVFACVCVYVLERSLWSEVVYSVWLFCTSLLPSRHPSPLVSRASCCWMKTLRRPLTCGQRYMSCEWCSKYLSSRWDIIKGSR